MKTMRISHENFLRSLLDSGLGVVSIIAITIISIFVLVIAALIVVAKVTKRWCFAGKKDTIV